MTFAATAISPRGDPRVSGDQGALCDHLDCIDFQQPYLVGVALIDRQNGQLIGIYNQYLRSIQQGSGLYNVDFVFGELVSYGKRHFPEEENIMKLARYHKYRSHTLQHHSFITTLTAFDRRMRQGQAGFEALAMFMGQWIRGHILISDRQFGEFFESAGLRGHLGGPA